MINETLLMALKQQIKITLSINGVNFPFHDALINQLTENHIKFTIPTIDLDKEYLKVYIFKLDCVSGVGYNIAGIDLPPGDDDDKFIDII